MNYDFSIESSIDKIQNDKTKEYFKEVYQTFVNGNYRSATVMLYSVLICDLVYKLRDLRDIYGDTKAKKIIEEIESLQSANPKSPDWENKLIEFISARTSLLEPSDIVAIESLQKFRHLSAHPILTCSDLLYSPNKDTVQSLIRNILDGVLTNPPFFSNKIFDTFLNDLVDVKDKITEQEGLEKYLHSRYLKRLKETDFKKLFRSLWKIVFISDDPKSNSYREITKRALIIVVNHNKRTCLDAIKREPTYFSNITKDNRLTDLIFFLTSFPEIFKILDDSLQLLLNGQINTNYNLILISWFQKASLEEHLDELDHTKISSIDINHVNFLKKICIQNNCADKLYNFLINYFGESESYSNTKFRYDNAIVPILDNLNLEQTKKLLIVSNNNHEIYDRTSMTSTIKKGIKQEFDSLIQKDLYNKIF